MASAKQIASWRKDGLCVGCGTSDLSTTKYCMSCIKAARKRYKQRKKSGLCVRCGKVPTDKRTTCDACKEHSNAKGKVWRDKIKLEVLSHYGGSFCSCCGESHLEFLSIDHIEGGGKKHQQSRVNTGQTRWLYQWLRKNGFPPGYRVLCFNCNCARGFLGYCPHELERKQNATSC